MTVNSITARVRPAQPAFKQVRMIQGEGGVSGKKHVHMARNSPANALYRSMRIFYIVSIEEGLAEGSRPRQNECYCLEEGKPKPAIGYENSKKHASVSRSSGRHLLFDRHDDIVSSL